jgi:hypothetical protein
MHATLTLRMIRKYISWSRVLLVAGGVIAVGLVGLVIAVKISHPGAISSASRASSADTLGDAWGSPEATLAHFRQAVEQRNWRDEHACYSAQLQARFALHVVLGIHELVDSRDLADAAHAALQKYGLPADLLERFPSLRQSDEDDWDSSQSESTLRQRQQDSQRRLERWTAEVYSAHIDWGGLIDDLQPLLMENFLRHEFDEHHASQTGVVFHLDFWVFDPVQALTTGTDRSEGKIIARERARHRSMSSESGIEWEWSPWDNAWQKLLAVLGWEQPYERPANVISLARVAEGWKIDAVPYR